MKLFCFCQEKENQIFSLSVSEIEIRDLEKAYLDILSSSYRQQQITLQIFSNLLTPVLPPMLIPGFFDAFDENRDGKNQRNLAIQPIRMFSF